MHGIVFIAIEQHLRARGDEAARRVCFPDANAFLAIGDYPDEELIRVANRIASRRSMASAHPVPEILRQLGEAIPPILQRLAPSLLPKAASFSELLAHMERAPSRKAILPRFATERKPDGLIGLTYQGEPRLCRFAEGLTVGFAALVGDPVGLRHPTCVARGDEACTFVVRFLRQETAHRSSRPGRTRSGV